MEQRLSDLRGDPIAATDGRIGSVKDVYFDDERWAVRYLVVDTGGWLTGRQVLISPASLDQPAAKDGEIHARLSREEVERAPGIEEDAPVSRLYEQAHAEYFRYPYYWTGPELWGFAPMPTLYAARDEVERRDEASRTRAREFEEAAERTHLRSGREVTGYRIRAEDGELGKVDDFLVDDQDWSIRGMVVDTKPWLPGGNVVVPRDAIQAIDYGEREVRVAMTREALRDNARRPG